MEIKEGWTDVNMWYDKDADGSWETTVLGSIEAKMTADETKAGWYYKIFKNTNSIKFLFNKGNWDEKLCNADGTDFAYADGPGEIWVYKDGSLKTSASTKTIIYFEKPVLWTNAEIKYKINNSTTSISSQMITYRPDWYQYEVKKEHVKFEFYIYNGMNKINNRLYHICDCLEPQILDLYILYLFLILLNNRVFL